jgi:hypothetical protein
VEEPQNTAMSDSNHWKNKSNIAEELETLLDEHEFSRITKRSVASARRDRLLKRGCPYVKLLGLVRYRPQDVREFINQNVREVKE